MDIFEVMDRILKMKTVYYESDDLKTIFIAVIGSIFNRWVGPILVMLSVGLAIFRLLNWRYVPYSVVILLAGRISIYYL